jgi:hypothetical protein
VTWGGLGFRCRFLLLGFLIAVGFEAASEHLDQRGRQNIDDLVTGSPTLNR